MTFMIKYNRGFGNEGKTYEAKVISRKLNGYNVAGSEGQTIFLCHEDIKILDISDEEKNLPIDFGW